MKKKRLALFKIDGAGVQIEITAGTLYATIQRGIEHFNTVKVTYYSYRAHCK
jgi:hypothetical protein